jgi:V/A-type H+-transporting ATPase subunit C
MKVTKEVGMPQPSIAYAVGRVRAASRKPLGEAQLERLIALPGYDETRHALSELGWSGAEDDDIERLSTQMLEKACKFLREVSPDPLLTDTFLLRHDAQNLKALLKARILGTRPEALSRCGTIPIQQLQHAIAERVYTKLPPEFRQAMQALEKSVTLGPDPAIIDVRLDQALYQAIENRMKKTGSPLVKQYFSAIADLQNAAALLRMRAMNRPPEAFLYQLLPGGTVIACEWAKMAGQPDLMPGRFKDYGRNVREALVRSVQNASAIPMFEKARDDYLLDLFKPRRNDAFSIEVLIGNFLAHEREMAAVRLILAGKLNGFSQDTIRERLREAYGR